MFAAIDAVTAYREPDVLYVPRRGFELRKLHYSIATYGVERRTDVGANHASGGMNCLATLDCAERIQCATTCADAPTVALLSRVAGRNLAVPVERIEARRRGAAFGNPLNELAV